jgi:uncharacterized membrane protein YhaH (DUF805 family)
MNIQDAVATCLAKYATFRGRASRSEYWWFILATTVFGWFAIIAGNSLAQGMGQLWNSIYSIAILLPTIAVATRRLHDVGRSGWWQLLLLTVLGIVLLIYWLAQPSQPGPNQYGEEPEADKGTPPASPSPPAAHSQSALQSALVIHSEPNAAPAIESREAPRGMMDWAKTPPVPASDRQAKRNEQSGSKGMPLVLIFIIAFAAFVVAYYAQNNGGALKDIFSRLQSTVSSVTTEAIAGGGGSGFQFSSEKDNMTGDSVHVGYQTFKNREGNEIVSRFTCMKKSDIIESIRFSKYICDMRKKVGRDCGDLQIATMWMTVTSFDRLGNPAPFEGSNYVVKFFRKLIPNGEIIPEITVADNGVVLGDAPRMKYNNQIQIAVPVEIDITKVPGYEDAKNEDDGSTGVMYRFSILQYLDPVDVTINFGDAKFSRMMTICNKNFPTRLELEGAIRG